MELHQLSLDISERSAAGYPDFAPSEAALGALRPVPTGGAGTEPVTGQALKV